MPTMAQLMAAKNTQGSSGESTPVVSETGVVPTEGVQETSGDSEQPAEQRPAAPVPAKGLRIGGIKLGARPGNPPVHSPSGGDETGKAGVEGGSLSAPDPSAGSNESGSVSHPLDGVRDGNGDSKEPPARTGLSLVDIAGVGTGPEPSTGIELASIDELDSTGYLEGLPATAPVRPIPEELEATQKAFIGSLDSIYRLHSDPEMFVDMVRKIMSEMQDNPDLAKLLAPEDSQAMIRGLRQQAGMAQVKKQESKAKRGGGKTKPQSAQVDSVMESLKSLAGFDGGFD